MAGSGTGSAEPSGVDAILVVMATIEQVEQRVFEVEGFRIRIKHDRDGRDVRSDKAHVKQYPYRRALKHSLHVKAWRDGRFALAYPGYEVDVLDADDRVAHGGTLLGTVRDGYLDDL